MPKLEQKQQLHQKLSPKQILEASLFQLNTFSLEQRIYQEIEKNPLLEIPESIKDDINDTDEDIDESLDDFEIDELYSNTDDFELPKSQTDSNYDFIENASASKNDQSDHLKIQIRDMNLKAIDEKIAFDIIENLDHKGYLAIEPVLIADRFDVELDKVLEIQKKILLMEPAGIASVNIRECLLSQLEFHNYNNSDAYIIIRDYFDDFSKANYDHISNKGEIAKKDIKKALDIISSLYLYPLDNSSNTVKETILPDIIMEKRNNDWVISINNSSTPELILNQKYTDMIEDDRTPSQTKTFIKKNYQSAQLFLDAIKQRNITMTRVMERICIRQSKYFNSENRILVPMILKDIAQDLNIDISTVSRICNGKYVQLPWEIVELRSFFNEGIKLKNGDLVSSLILKDDITNIIDNELSDKPLKDEDITKILNKKGYQIARRTVSKYRENLNIPNSSIRKKIKGLQQ